MDDRPHKAHRPSQSGAKAEKKKGKGKEKQKGFNEKVRPDPCASNIQASVKLTIYVRQSC